jgi:NitT/TauT family transport system substrate-binding protein
VNHNAVQAFVAAIERTLFSLADQEAKRTLRPCGSIKQEKKEMHSKKFHFILTLVTLLSLAMGACAQAATPAPETTAAATEAAGAAELVTLKIAVLPILEALPMYVADQKGYFTANGVKVEFIPVQSAAERDQVMAAGQADGMINDLVSTLFYNKDSIQIQIVRFARTATPEFPQYRILAAKDSGIETVEDLKGVPIGISEGSVIAYTTDRLLQAEGLAPEDIMTAAVPRIPDRLSLLASGELKAANMPDPFSLLAIQGGATVVVDDSKHPEYGNSVYSFRKAVIDEQPEAVRGFLAAVDQAITDINENKEEWNSLLTEKQLVPAPVAGEYLIPNLPAASYPTQEQWQDVVSWAQEKGLVDKDVSYEDSVNPSFIQ